MERNQVLNVKATHCTGELKRGEGGSDHGVLTVRAHPALPRVERKWEREAQHQARALCLAEIPTNLNVST